MTTRGLPTLLLASAFLCACGHASVAVKRDYDFRSVRRVAVLGFDDYGHEAGSGDMVASVFEKYLLKAGYDVVERRDVDKLLKEQAFSVSGAVDPQKAQQLGKILGIDAMVLGSITDFAHDKSQTILPGQAVSTYSTYPYYPRRRRYYYAPPPPPMLYTPPQAVPQTFARVGLAARMVDVATGSILWIGSDTEEDSTIPQAAEETSEEIMDGLKRTWPVRLLR